MSDSETCPGPERRRSTRRAVSLPARLEGGGLADADAEVSTLSLHGCFVLADDIPAAGQLIRLDLLPPGEEAQMLWGSVVFRHEGTGFALHFSPHSQGGARHRLEDLLSTPDD